MNDKWIVFSYSIPATNAKARMRIWRRITATGAAQLKTGLQILPYREELMDNITWLVGEVHSLGGEAIALRCSQLEGISDQLIEKMFQNQVDVEFKQLQGDAQALLTAANTASSDDDHQDTATSLRKLRKRCEAVRMRDFFPSGEAAKTLNILNKISEQLRQPGKSQTGISRFDSAQFRGRIWVTRAHPYVDRLSSAWLIKRFIDTEAEFRFLQPGESVDLQSEIPFDMAVGEFTHRNEMITFEVLAQDFAIDYPAVITIGELIHCLDVQENSLPDDAILLKTLIDGLVSMYANDHQLLEQACLLFDSLFAGYTKSTY